jgi:alkyldihydroxyacetonephosphate synthase
MTTLFFNSYPVDRTSGSGSGAGLSTALLDQGVPLLIFPEGTRSRTGEPGRFKAGAASLARTSRIPVVPVAIVGAHQAMPVGTFWPRWGRRPVRVVVGAPVDTRRKGETLGTLNRRIAAAVLELMDAGTQQTQEGVDMSDRSGVTHQKWWGWGVDGVAFHHEDKPGFAPFVLQNIGLDVTSGETVAPDFGAVEVPASRLPDDLAATLRAALGDEHVVLDDLDRVVHTYGKGLRDLVRIRANLLPRVPDVVVYPADEDQVRAVVDATVAADAVLIPFGGGSNISGSLTPPVDEPRPIVSLDLGRLDRVLEIDEGSGLARIQAGVLGPSMEEQLGARGWTTGHQPDSFTHSTLGGWVATRSSGMQSDRYGDIADITRGMRVVQPGKVVVLRPLPSTSTGPSVREMMLGSEGRLGVITEVWVQVHRLPERREIQAFLFPSWEAGLAALHALSESDLTPSVTRVSDAHETQFSLATQKESKGVSGLVSKGLFEVLRRRGWDLDQACLSFIGFEGGTAHVRAQKLGVTRLVGRHGGIPLGKKPGTLYDQKKFDTPYIRDFLLDQGALGDVSETAAPWSRLNEVYNGGVAAVRKAFAELGLRGWVMCHLSHSYHSGACLYFTFAFPPHEGSPEQTLEQYDAVKSAVQQSFVDNGATLSHHHGVGVDHAPWLEADISEAGTDVMVALLKGVDPGRNLNPGTLIPPHREW